MLGICVTNLEGLCYNLSATLAVSSEGPVRGGCQSLFPCPQVFVSKDVAKHLGFQSAAEALRGLYGRVKKG